MMHDGDAQFATFEPTLDFSKAPNFLKRVQETIIWYEHPMGAGHSVREIHAVPKDYMFCSADRAAMSGYRYGKSLSHVQRKQILDDLFEQRRSWLAPFQEADAARGMDDRHKDQFQEDPLCYGRLVVFRPDESLSDGAAGAATKGFFDSHNEPGWDIWVDYIVAVKPIQQTRYYDKSATQGFLVAWIPAYYIDTVSDGIEVNPERCIKWLADSKTAFADALRR